MNEKALRVLEYNKIIDLLERQAGSEITRKAISELQPFKDPRKIATALEETDEASRLISFKGALPLGNFYNINGAISFAKKGGSLTLRQLLQIYYNLKVTRDVKNFMKGDIPELPILQELTNLLETFVDLENEIDRTVENEDEVKDTASPELRSIRRNIVRQNEAIRNRINQMINKSDNQSMLQDAIVTVRDGRFVIPVKQEYRGKFPGIIHDQSSTGATLFIEPQIIVNLNNELRELEISEKVEIERIIAELSSRVAEHFLVLRNNQDILLQLDMIMAKGKLAHIHKAECPNVNDQGILDLKQARHPLIDEKKAVPIDILLGKDYKALIVTGPNTGGKTVTLKTAGLLCMMAQTGLHIPASSQSTIPVYEDIFADIGDEQSIEQSLSTFSSHMTNIVNIVKNAGNGTLALIDELGAGTDPTEGAALAISIIETLKKQGAHILATTHYTELKKYALETEDVENASMEFNVETLSPTYKLTIGIPGKSNAFEISKKLGLPIEIIQSSKNLLEGGDIEFERVLQAIEADKKEAKREREEAQAILRDMEAKEATLNERLEKAKAKEKNMINKAKEEARSILADAKQVTKNVQEELKELYKLETLGEKTKRLESSKRKVKDAAGRYKEVIKIEENDNPVSIKDIQIGDRVKVMTLNQNGEIIGLPDSRGEMMVQVGPMKMKCKAKDLKIIIDGRKKKKPKITSSRSTYASLYKSKTQNIKTSVNVQGENLEDALDKVSKYIDDAMMAHLEEVTIIHGRGGGILKKGIHQMLRDNPMVKEYRKGAYSEGGDGVTVVKLK